ncbi:GNAT family N-acetyltransferase [Rhodobacteraceae bacterium]|nr:GNAT family N-acetyltransferase [Paracoccaceae bacterium]
MTADTGSLQLRMAADDVDIKAAQRLRYRVFVEELGGSGPLVDHSNRFEADAFDPVCDHLLLIDPDVDPDTLEHVVGAYRVLPSDRADRFGRYYCDAEYDLDKLRNTGRKLLELGRSCVHPAHRGGTALLQLWSGLADYVVTKNIEILFGVASFHGTDIQRLRMPLAWLHHNHLAPEPLRATARSAHVQRMDLMPASAVDRRAASAALPGLIKSYLKLGGFVGEGAFIDHAFNTTDVLLLMDTKAMSEKHRSYYTRRAVAR